MDSDAFAIVPADTKERVRMAKSLFEEYAASLDVDLCFQGFQDELAGLPGDYAPPAGQLLLLLCDQTSAGCVALRKIDDDVCELKRMYVRPAYRGRQWGRKLVEAIIGIAREIGYRRVRLDTLPTMTAAIALYQSVGFREIGPYRFNPVEGHKQMELVL